MRRSSSSAGARYAPAVIGQIRILLISVSPRRFMASCQPGSACTISSTRWYSESTIGNCPSAAVSTVRALITLRRPRDTTTSVDSPVFRLMRKARSRRSTGAPASTSSLGGSSSP